MRALMYRMCIVVLLASGAPGRAAEVPGFVLSDDGAAVIDLRSGLAWSRCVEGMTWRAGACRGEAVLASYGEAAALAKKRAARDGLAWRVPTMNELKTLSERLPGAGRAAGDLFPQPPGGWYWTSSVRVETARVNPYDYANVQRGLTEQNVNRIAYLHGWVVDAETGRARSDMPRRTPLPVRLVRRAQP